MRYTEGGYSFDVLGYSLRRTLDIDLLRGGHQAGIAI